MSFEPICAVQIEKSTPTGIIVVSVEYARIDENWVRVASLDFDGQDVDLTETESLLAQCLVNAGAVTWAMAAEHPITGSQVRRRL